MFVRFMLFEVIKAVPLVRKNARTVRRLAVVVNILAHLGQGKVCFASQCWTDRQTPRPPLAQRREGVLESAPDPLGRCPNNGHNGGDGSLRGAKKRLKVYLERRKTWKEANLLHRTLRSKAFGTVGAFKPVLNITVL